MECSVVDLFMSFKFSMWSVQLSTCSMSCKFSIAILNGTYFFALLGSILGSAFQLNTTIIIDIIIFITIIIIIIMKIICMDFDLPRMLSIFYFIVFSLSVNMRKVLHVSFSTVFYTLSGRSSALVWYSEGRTIASDSVQ